ncbi:MAG: HPr family phosphocarrier protein [Planctomycetales bacterium]|nr:HPr family phosphocarrier protein [Planctomycetales bacterium]
MPQDASQTVVIGSPQGLHLRPAHAFATLASKFSSKITVTRDADSVDGKSILDLATLAAAEGHTLVIHASGEDAEQAVEELAALLAELAQEEKSAE